MSVWDIKVVKVAKPAPKKIYVTYIAEDRAYLVTVLTNQMGRFWNAPKEEL